MRLVSMKAVYFVRAASLAALAGFVLFSQEATFEVASVKPAVPVAGRAGKGGPGFSDPSLFSVRNATLKRLILQAYDVKQEYVSGGPAWIDDDRFDVDAKPAAPTPREQMMPMLRALLAERFQLEVHRETRTIPTYVLSVAKGGPKFGPQFRKLGEGERPNLPIPALNQYPDPKLGMSMGGPMDRFAQTVGRHLENNPPVVDQTGLAGEYDIFVKGSTGSGYPGPKDDWPSLIQDQLGLKLELRKLPAEMLIVDSAKKPEGN